MIKKIKEFILRQYSTPSWIGIWVTPFYFAQRTLYLQMKMIAPMVQGRLLDVGCGSMPYKNLFSLSQDNYLGLEFDSPESRSAGYADYFYDGSTFPFSDQSFDGIICNQVFEHVFNPEEFLKEILRVMKPGGRLIISVPFAWDEHLQPWDFARYTSFGLNSLLDRSGFKVLVSQKLNDDIGAIFQIFNLYLHKILLTKSGKLNLIICMVLISPFTLMGLLLVKILPRNPDFFLGQLVVAEKI